MSEPNDLPAPARGLAIVLLVLAGLTLLVTPCSLLALVLDQKGPSASMLKDPVMRGWSYFGMTAGVLLALVRMTGAIGLLSRRPWSVTVLTGEAIAAIAVIAVSIPVNLLVVAPRMMEMMKTAGRASGPAGQQAAAVGGAVGGVIGGSISSVFGLALAVATLIIVRRPDVREALARRPLPAGLPRFPGLPGDPPGE